jgi:hypothetical protein
MTNSQTKAPQKTMVTLLLDKSTSMQSMHEQTVSGINAWIKELQQGEGDTRFTLVQFSSIYNRTQKPTKFPNLNLGQPQANTPLMRGLHGGAMAHSMDLVKTIEMKPIAEVKPLMYSDFKPEGGTPLIDAAMDAIHALEKSVADRPDIKVILAIQTDGEENTSKKYKWDDLRRAVSAKEEMGWEIIFMAAGLDAVHQADKFGLHSSKTLAYGTDQASTMEAFRTTGAKTRAFSTGEAKDMAYSTDERLRSGDMRQL